MNIYIKMIIERCETIVKLLEISGIEQSKQIKVKECLQKIGSILTDK